ncbi:MAG: hypothetical protein M1830_008092 [Pleopsidium flavum]|nr:MAG: hypothetical protein M1830_008092 [Pleopsidium flavum]
MSSSTHSSYISGLIQEIHTEGNKLPDDVFQDDKTRRRLQEAAFKLMGALDNPIDGVRRIIFQPHQLYVTRVAIEGGWFMALADGDQPKKATELAKATGAQRSLIVRLMRVLTSGGIVAEVGPETYASTPVSKALTYPPVYDGVKHFFDEGLNIFCKFPEYLIRNGYKVPEEPSTGPFAYTFGQIQWDYFRDHPERGKSFNVFMAGQREGRQSWLDVYPLEKQLQHDLREDKEAVLLVDIAGGRGHDVKDFKARHAKLPGRVILQDLPEVIAQVDPNWKKGIEPMAYDFFTPQPIKGARAYYFRSILHDWDDNSCRNILQNQISAMEKDYSRLLVNDMVLPDVGAAMFPAAMDVSMMTLLTGMERTRAQWHELLDSVGLKINGIWTLVEGGESVIETVLKD